MAQRAITDVWIDTDPSIGLPFHDADDGFALIQAFRSRALRVRGISVTYGNTTLGKATAITQKIARLYGGRAGVSERMVFAGANSAADIGQSTDATAALARELSSGKRLTYLALGPLTNLATLLKCQPALANRIERVVFLGGRSPGEHFRLGTRNSYEFHDANFEKDVPAAAEVLHSNLLLTLTPAMLSKQVLLTPDDLDRLWRDGGAAGQFLSREADPWLRLWRLFFGLEGGPVFDSMTVLAASDPSQMNFSAARAFISSRLESGDTTPAAGSSARQYLLAIPEDQLSSASQAQGGKSITLCTSVKPGTKRLLVDRLAGARP